MGSGCIECSVIDFTNLYNDYYLFYNLLNIHHLGLHDTNLADRETTPRIPSKERKMEKPIVPSATFKTRVRNDAIGGPNPFEWKDLASDGFQR